MKNNSILDSLKKIYTKMTGKKVVKRKTETDVLSDIAESYDPNQGGGGSSYTAGTGIDITNNEISIDDTVVAKKEDLPDEVSGTNDGTNWTSLTIGNTTKAIPQGGGGGGLNIVELNYPVIPSPSTEVTVQLTQEELTALLTADMVKAGIGLYLMKADETEDGQGNITYKDFSCLQVGNTSVQAHRVTIHFSSGNAIWVFHNLQISAES